MILPQEIDESKREDNEVTTAVNRELVCNWLSLSQIRFICLKKSSPNKMSGTLNCRKYIYDFLYYNFDFFA